MTPEIITPFIIGGCAALCVKFISRATVVVWDHEVALHFKHGKLIGTLEAGKHVFWGRGHEFVKKETRLQMLPIQTQEIHTADSIAVKLTALVVYKENDHELVYRSAADVTGSLYAAVQLAMRDAVAAVELDKLTGVRGSLSEEILTKVNIAAKKLGIEVQDAAIRDVILPGDIKAAQHEAMRARKEAMAKLETARGEAAAMRTLANAFKQIEAHPEALKLKYLEVLEKAAQNGCNTFVIGGNDDALKLVR